MKNSVLLWSPYSILISSPKGLRRIRCPFPVENISAKEFNKGYKTYVNLVKENPVGRLVFEINGAWYAHRHWKII